MNMVFNTNSKKNTVLFVTNKRDIRTFELQADFTNANKVFYDKYGDVIAPILYKTLYQDQMLHSGYNGWFRFYKKQNGAECSETEAYRKLLKYSSVFLPHEEAEYHTFKAVESFNKNNDVEEFGDLKLQDEPRYSHQGYTKYWKFLSDRKHAVKQNDLIQFGISFRNGIGTNVALGGDLYSYRLACLNGAVAKDKKRSFTAIHKGSVQKMIEELVDGIAHIMQGYKQLLEAYQRFTVTKLTQQNLTQILQNADIPYYYLPEDIVEVISKKEDKTLPNTIVKLRKTDATLWDLFNGITNPLTRAEALDQSTKEMKKLSYSIFADRTSQLHKAMIPLVTVK